MIKGAMISMVLALLLVVGCTDEYIVNGPIINELSSTANVSGNGTTGYIPQFYNSTTITDSNIYENTDTIEFTKPIQIGNYNISTSGGDLYIG